MASKTSRKIQDYFDLLPIPILLIVDIYLGWFSSNPRKRDRVWEREQSELEHLDDLRGSYRWLDLSNPQELGLRIREALGRVKPVEPDWDAIIRPCFLDFMPLEVGTVHVARWFYDAWEPSVSLLSKDSKDWNHPKTDPVWKSFDAHACYLLTKCRQRGLQEVVLTHGNHSRRVNLIDMTQTHLQTKRFRLIKMVHNCKSFPVPEFFEQFISERTLQSKLEPGGGQQIEILLDWEHNSLRRFHKSFFEQERFVIPDDTAQFKIFRLVNRRAFQCFRAQMESFENKSVVLAWHGCGATDPDMVVRNGGLSLSFAGTNNRWGTGHYLSSNALVSHKHYSVANNSKRTLFLALVALGDAYCAEGGDDYKISKGPFTVHGELCDSIMGPDMHVPNATNFCVAKDSQAFLLYRFDYTTLDLVR